MQSDIDPAILPRPSAASPPKLVELGGIETTQTSETSESQELRTKLTRAHATLAMAHETMASMKHTVAKLPKNLKAQCDPT